MSNCIVNGKRCPVCGSRMKLRNGSHGMFFGCAKYPRCTYTEQLSSSFSVVIEEEETHPLFDSYAIEEFDSC